jgi:hypothetical protein
MAELVTAPPCPGPVDLVHQGSLQVPVSRRTKAASPVSRSNRAHTHAELATNATDPCTYGARRDDRRYLICVSSAPADRPAMFETALLNLRPGAH